MTLKGQIIIMHTHTNYLCASQITPHQIHLVIPKYFCTNSDPTMVMKEAVVALATAFAIIVLPVPAARGERGREKLGGEEKANMKSVRQEINSIVPCINAIYFLWQV